MKLSSIIREIASRLEELDRLYGLNLELLEQLDVTCEWLIDNIPQIPNIDKLRSLLLKVDTLLTEIYSDSPLFLQNSKVSDENLHDNKSDEDFTEPVQPIYKGV